MKNIKCALTIALLLLVQITSGCGDKKIDNNNSSNTNKKAEISTEKQVEKPAAVTKKYKKENKVPADQRKYFEQAGVPVPPDQEVEYVHQSNGRLSEYSFFDNGQYKGKFYVVLNEEDKIEHTEFKHFTPFGMCQEYIPVVSKNKKIGGFKERLNIHLSNEKAKNLQELKQHVKIK